ncbi:MAG: SBBP repeat-containing protein [Candidatus Cloacimonetes bacterium]|nr:SBBP repeat-containing protein [Candidatus Cloacimonadota bacterium]
MKKLMFIILMGLCSVMLFAQTEDWLWANRAGGTSYDRGQSISIDADGNGYVTGRFQGTATFGSTTLTSSGSYYTDIFVVKLDPNGNWLWAKQAGGESDDVGYGIATDAYGNSYVTGYFRGTASFGSTTLTSSGYGDVFVAKLDTNGNWLWARQAGGTDHDHGSGFSTDASGNCYVTGYFSGTVTFGTTTLTSSGDEDVFVAKLDPNGNWLWAKKAGGASYDYGNGISTDASGNCYVTGFYQWTASFGSITLTSSGVRDIFVAKLDSNGNWLWALQAGGTGGDGGFGISTDASGNSYVTGYFMGTASFGSTTLTSSGITDIFVAKLDPNGNWLWAQQAGGTGGDIGQGISTDAIGNCYVTGDFSGTTSFGSTSLTSSGDKDFFVAKLDINGNWLWAKKAGGTSEDYCYGIDTDASGNSYVTGYFYETATFGSTTLTSSGYDDIFVAKVGESVEIDDNIAPDANVVLIGNYPNPFSLQTEIKYELKASAPVRIDIYNLKGQLVSTLVNEAKTAGLHGVVWNGLDKNNRQVVSGIYYYTMTSGNFTATRKLILLK